MLDGDGVFGIVLDFLVLLPVLFIVLLDDLTQLLALAMLLVDFGLAET